MENTKPVSKSLALRLRNWLSILHRVSGWFSKSCILSSLFFSIRRVFKAWRCPLQPAMRGYAVHRREMQHLARWVRAMRQAVHHKAKGIDVHVYE